MDQFTLKHYMAKNPDAKLRDIVTDLIYDEIINLKLIPGTKLNVNQISSSLGVSRTPVAEAIAKLTEIGFVVQHEGQTGSFVLNLDLHDMINLYRVRSAIESEAAALCAHAADDETVSKLYALAEAFEASVVSRDIRGMKETDMPFHRIIIDSCGNSYVIECYNQLLPKLTMYQSSMLKFIGDRSNQANPWLPSVKYNHISVVSSIRMRMPELARKAMEEHVDASLNFTALSGNGGDPFLTLNGK
ncbi:MAG: GntR family transcriptional regulator [Candidatus Limivicinus sp.]|jgi:DNA-binding GntR family transcriptional regulator